MSQVPGHQEQGQLPESLDWKRFKKSQKDTNHRWQIDSFASNKIKEENVLFYTHQ